MELTDEQIFKVVFFLGCYRDIARIGKDYKLADRIRIQINDLGYQIEDIKEEGFYLKGKYEIKV